MNAQYTFRRAFTNPNYADVYEALWRQGLLTRGKLSSITDLAVPTVARIVANLIKLGLVQEIMPAQEPIASGRPASAIAVTPRAGYLIGIDLSGIEATGALLALNNEILAGKTTPIVKGDTAGIASALTEMVQDLLIASQVGKEAVLGVGIGLPSSVDLTRNMVLDASNLGIKEWNVVAEMSNRLQMPVFIENDANAAAIAEYYFANSGVENLAYISLGAGIGMGLIIHGQLFVGSLGNAGELGHVVVMPEGPRCTCGRKGCLEALASGWAIARAYTIEKTPGVTEHSSLAEVTCEEVFALAEKGDEVAVEVMERAATLIGLAIIGIVNTLGMNHFVLGGSMAVNHPNFAASIRHSALANAPSEYADQIFITCTALQNTGVLGAASLVMQNMLAGTNKFNENIGSNAWI